MAHCADQTPKLKDLSCFLPDEYYKCRAPKKQQISIGKIEDFVQYGW